MSVMESGDPDQKQQGAPPKPNPKLDPAASAADAQAKGTAAADAGPKTAAMEPPKAASANSPAGSPYEQNTSGPSTAATRATDTAPAPAPAQTGTRVADVQGVGLSEAVGAVVGPSQAQDDILDEIVYGPTHAPPNVQPEINYELHMVAVHTVPLVMIVSLKIMNDNFWLCLVYNTLAQFYVPLDHYLVKQVAKPVNDAWTQLYLCIIIAGSLFFGLRFPSGTKHIPLPGAGIYPTLIFKQAPHLKKHAGDFWKVAVTTTTACLILKLLFLAAKATIALLPVITATPLSRPAKKRLYKLLELLCQLYCECVCILPWWAYFRTAGETPTLKQLNILIAIMYLNYKAFKVLRIRVPNVQEAVESIVKHKFGSSYMQPLAPDKLTDGDKCLICLAKPNEPVAIQCQHSFCTSCISRWVEVERKGRCPVCRKDIGNEDDKWMGAESTILLLGF